jgi:hypothetical protein
MLYIKNNEVKNIKKIVIVVNGRRIFNPSVAQVLADGWVKYEPQIPEIEVDKEEQYKQRIVELIREKYSVDDELAIQRQRDSKVEEFNEYNVYAESCKELAYNEIYGDSEI